MAKFRRRRLVPTSAVGIGMNLSGLEWNSSLSKTAVQGFNSGSGCNVPALGFIKWLANQGVDTVRIPVAWEFLQPCLYDATSVSVQSNYPYVKAPGDIHAEFKYILKRLLDECSTYNIKLVLDLHNYGTYYDIDTYGATGPYDGTSQRYGGSTEWFKYSAGATSGTVTFTAGSTTISMVSGSVPLYEPVRFTVSGGSLPSNIAAGTTYYVVTALSTTGGAISATPGGAPITFADAGSGTISIASPRTISYSTRTFGAGNLTAAHLSDVFTRLANLYDSHPALLGYGLMNEVGLASGLTETSWVAIANQAIAAIRATGSTKAIFVDGPYANAVSNPYTSASFATIVDSANNTYREIHQYLDANRSGAYSGWDYDQRRGFCVDLAGVTGNVTAVAGIRAQSLIEAQRLSGRKVWIGECAFLNTHDRYIELSRIFVRAIRQASTGVHSMAPVLWGASSLAWFPKDYRSEPKMHGTRTVPDPAISVVMNDAGVENAVLAAYVDVSTNTLTVEAVGSLTKTLTVTVACTDTGVTLSKNVLTIKHGVQQFDTLTFTNPVAATATFSFTASRLTSPESVTILNYTDSGSDATQGLRALQRTRSAIFLAGSGRSTWAGDTGQPFEGIVPNSGVSNGRQAIRTALAYSIDKLRLVEGANRLPMWKNYTFDSSRMTYNYSLMGLHFTGPGGGVTNAYTATSTGLSNPNASPFQTRGARWHASCSFEVNMVDKYLSNRPLFGVYNRNGYFGFAIMFASTTPYNRIGLRVWSSAYPMGTTVFGASPTTVTLNAVHTVTVDYNDGNISVYLDGVLELSFTEAASENRQGTFTAGTTASNRVTLSAPGDFTGYQGYAPIISPVLPAGTWATTTSTSGVVDLVDKNFQPVTPISDPVGATYRIARFYDSISVLGHHTGYFPVTISNGGARVAGFSYGVGALSANDAAGIAAYFNGRSNAAALWPSNTTAPTLSGIAKVGQVITCTQGSWSNTPQSYAYQWYRGVYPIPGATGTSYTITSADVGDIIQCAVTATNASGSSLPFLVTLRCPVPDELVTTALDFATDTLDAAPAGIVAANSGSILVKNTGATNLQGRYIVDQGTTAATNVYTLSGTTPGTNKTPHRVRVTFEGGTVGILIQAQAGTTVAGYPGLLQGYYLIIRPSGGSDIYAATATGLVAIATGQYPDWPNTGVIHASFMWENGRIFAALSTDGVNFGRWASYADNTFPTSSGPCQITLGNGAAPNTARIGQIRVYN